MNACSKFGPWVGLVYGCALLHSIVGETGAAEWPMFRGNPGLTGVAQGALPDKLSSLWTFKTGSSVKSSAAIAGNRVFFGSADESIYAVDLADGKKLWSYKQEARSNPLLWCLIKMCMSAQAMGPFTLLNRPLAN